MQFEQLLLSAADRQDGVLASRDILQYRSVGLSLKVGLASRMRSLPTNTHFL